MDVLTHPILDQLAQLGLTGMAQVFAELETSGEGVTLTHADWLGLLVDREITHRRDKRLAARLRYPRLRYPRLRYPRLRYPRLRYPRLRYPRLRYPRLRHSAVIEDVDYRRDLYEILEERYRRRSTILTSQVPVDNWHEVIGNPTYADAILDRLVHNAYRINLTGDSLRRTRPKSTARD